MADSTNTFASPFSTTVSSGCGAGTSASSKLPAWSADSDPQTASLGDAGLGLQVVDSGTGVVGQGKHESSSRRRAEPAGHVRAAHAWPA